MIDAAQQHNVLLSPLALPVQLLSLMDVLGGGGQGGRGAGGQGGTN
jgi:hypothetical protein